MVFSYGALQVHQIFKSFKGFKIKLQNIANVQLYSSNGWLHQYLREEMQCAKVEKKILSIWLLTS